VHDVYPAVAHATIGFSAVLISEIFLTRLVTCSVSSLLRSIQWRHSLWMILHETEDEILSIPTSINPVKPMSSGRASLEAAMTKVSVDSRLMIGLRNARNCTWIVWVGRKDE
jgi:hypothetical protein